ncbi:hypothetical protein T07_4502 [Trichinella nelsoni]|uniref:Uncharacterized protein n=1 Tax=Trichinella nelsoni TaxID=6336 RepID=A0A0V0RVP1_9BILA|nr:hypothetical protein T07_4502 [Trichinella nelsoni]
MVKNCRYLGSNEMVIYAEMQQALALELSAGVGAGLERWSSGWGWPMAMTLSLSAGVGAGAGRWRYRWGWAMALALG